MIGEYWPTGSAWQATTAPGGAVVTFDSEIQAKYYAEHGVVVTEAEAKVSENAATEWITGAKALLRNIEDALTEAGRLKMLYEDNDLLALTLSTPDDENVPGMGVSKLRSIAIGSLLQDVVAFLSEPTVGEGGMTLPTRRKVIVQRD